MKWIIIALVISFQIRGSSQNDSRFSIEILDSEALQLIDPEAEIIELVGGFQWTEGPLFLPDQNALLFSDIPRNSVFKIDATGEILEYLHPSGFLGEDFAGREPGSNGLLLSPEGDLVLMQHGERQVARMLTPLDDPRPEFVSLSSHFQGKRLNSPNDGIYDSEGNLYFTDPPYGLPRGMEDPGKELPYQGVYCLTSAGDLLLVDTLSRPNGITLSPDEDQIYVAVSDLDHAAWYRYNLVEAGKVENKRLFYEVTDLVGQEGWQGLPDGMKMHSKGYLFASGPGGIWIFNDEAIPIAHILTGERTSNCAFSAVEKWLFMTADDYVLKVKLK